MVASPPLPGYRLKIPELSFRLVIPKILERETNADSIDRREK